jgi:hypothetical protein
MGPASVATQRQADGNGPLPPGFPVPQWGVGDHVLPARGAPSDPPARTVRPQIPSSLSRSIIPPPRFLPILSYSPHLPFLLSGPSLVYLRSRKFLCFRRRAVTGVYERTPCVGFASNQPLPRLRLLTTPSHAHTLLYSSYSPPSHSAPRYSPASKLSVLAGLESAKAAQHNISIPTTLLSIPQSRTPFHSSLPLPRYSG